MPQLHSGNSSVDKESGAVMFHKSPELLEIIKLREEMKNLNSKMDVIIQLLKGGTEKDGREMG